MWAAVFCTNFAAGRSQQMPKQEKSKWYDEGIQFECQGSGKCCMSRGEYGFVYLTDDDAANAARALKITKKKFIEDYCEYDEKLLALKGDPNSPDCIFLNDKKCSIYEGRPVQCRTWPFWPEVMNAKAWKKNVESFCPGVNKGRLYTKEEIEKVLKEQKDADQRIAVSRG